jgi:hypothetical protein
MKGLEKKKAIVELSSQQDKTILDLAQKKRLYKVDVIRKLIDVLDGLDGDIHIIAYDNANVAVLSNFKDILNLKRESNITEFNFTCKYTRSEGVRCDSSFVTATTFGGHND